MADVDPELLGFRALELRTSKSTSVLFLFQRLWDSRHFDARRGGLKGEVRQQMRRLRQDEEFDFGWRLYGLRKSLSRIGPRMVKSPTPHADDNPSTYRNKPLQCKPETLIA